MISFTEYALRHPDDFREALKDMDILRIAELFDRGDESEVGRIVRHVIDISIHQEKCLGIPRLEPITKKCRKLEIVAPSYEDDLLMLRPQAD